MISCFSAAVSRAYRPPHRRPPDFFECAILEDRRGHDLLELAVFAAQVLDFRRRRFACRIAQQPLLAGLKAFFAPAVIEIRRQGIVKLKLIAVSGAKYGGFTTDLSAVSWGSID